MTWNKHEFASRLAARCADNQSARRAEGRPTGDRFIWHMLQQAAEPVCCECHQPTRGMICQRVIDRTGNRSPETLSIEGPFCSACYMQGCIDRGELPQDKPPRKRRHG